MSENPVVDALPRPSERNVALRIDRSGERQLRKRHPWLFEMGVRQQSHEGKTGDLAVVFDHARKFLAVGLYDPRSTLRVRVLHAGKPLRVDQDFFRRRLHELAEQRAALDDGRTDGYRVVHGENEGMPGFVLDRYADTSVLKLYTPAWIPHLPALLPALRELPGGARIYLRLSREARRRGDELHGLEDGMLLHGDPPTEDLIFRENGLRFRCDPQRGQKTGFFLDQRDNRQRIERLAPGRRVLNVFSYSGGFSLYAARGGAPTVTSLDQSRPALDDAEHNFALNQDDPMVAASSHQTLEADAFTALQDLARSGHRYGLLVIDPPSFAQRQDDIPKALEAYRRLAELVPPLMDRNGILAFASCSSRVTPEDFFPTVLQTLARKGRPAQEIERTGHASDHPVGFPQGEYLKCLFAKLA